MTELEKCLKAIYLELPEKVADDVNRIVNEALRSERSLHSEALLENSKWQAMCEKFVGCSMLSDEFAGEPHEPESFGMYVENLLTQIKELEAKLAEAVQEEREACARVAEIEPELPGDMPDKMWEAVRNDRDACQESHKITVRGTKKNIAQAIRARSNLSRQSEKEK